MAESATGAPQQPFRHYFSATPKEEEAYYSQHGVRGSRSFFKSPRGISLFTRSWLPHEDGPPPRAVLLMIHGYGDDVSWTFQMTPIFLAAKGFACFAFDLEGHGRSDGLRAFVPDVDAVVGDCLSFLGAIRERHPEYRNLPFFLYGESIGGAICLLTHFADRLGFRGAVLVAPMCKISEKVRPRWPILEILSVVAKVLPSLPIVPMDIMLKSIKVKEKVAVAEMNPMRYRGKPRPGTVLELLRVTEQLSLKLSDVSIPFIVLHGNADVVTDPVVSRTLYERARSEDKTIKIYEGMMHSLLFGETDENIEIVRNDILSWLEYRCTAGGQWVHCRKANKVAVGATKSSFPVNIPDWSKILKGDYSGRDLGAADYKENGDWPGGTEEDSMWVPPHVYLARRRGPSFSVLEGVGRTLKGRDLQQVRNEVWKKVGYED
ncbi:hypothetical protein SAY86_007022 [Trapa natans]|uniref:Serine aminopeptidase S33 domain-containing protein n=1 Tax=Trapa natans TaxID=22666 RepID=A0AAN7LGL7_TRANT|nr:hypothetical protein SAY86_007022 [Trapa natans]